MDDNFATRVQQRWADEAKMLEQFNRMSWGTAYQTIAEVQLILRIGQAYGVTLNLYLHSVSPGRDDESGITNVDIRTVGYYLNGQAPGTWKNKFTFFFAVYAFLEKTSSNGGEDLGDELYRARQAMLSWNVGLDVPQEFLPRGDKRASFVLLQLHRSIKNYMVSPPTTSVSDYS